MADNVVKLKVQKNSLNRLARKIRDSIDSEILEAGGITVAEVMGILEMVKIEYYDRYRFQEEEK